MIAIEPRAVMRFFTLKGLWPQQIQTELSGVHHEQAF
jgi:hypothetical protein